jgi:hypothetical protein
MTTEVHLYVIETDPERAKKLGAELARLSQVTVLEKYSDAVAASGGLDAVFVPLMSAMEWGVIVPPAPLHQTRVVQTPAYEVAQGRPQYAIPGVAISPGETLAPIDVTRLVLQESFKAIHRFNETSPVKLRSVLAPAISLGLDNLRPGEAMDILSDAYLSQVA